MATITKEKEFQKDITDYLESTGYEKRTTKDYSVPYCLDIELLIKFIQNTQKDEWEKFEKVHKQNAVERFVKSLVQNIERKGTIEVLRNGFRDVRHFNLFYPKPNTSLNPKSEERFNKNIFSVVEELEYEDKPNGNRLDLVTFINGIPITTIELKDTFSQGVENAIKQYKTDRDPKEKLLKRALIHFAMSDEKIFMTTKLDGDNTKFLPFNKGIENPIIENNYKTSYLYTEILQPNQLSRLINNFIFEENGTVIFPRFHQLDAVNMLLKNPKPGNNYLIQHSAGSGKTKTIAWLAHGLLNKFNENNKRIYDMVIVVSDRRVIDSQLQNQVKTIEKKQGVVEKIDKNSAQLAEAIKSGTNIVVTTIHKFSYILDQIQDLENRNYAIIVDEAHSSQTGTHAKNLKLGLSSHDASEEALDDAEDDIDKEIIDEIEKRRKTPNLSFFAFTATPKNKTLELFGKKTEYEQGKPHHVYSMKQAINEGFILDVLKNYITYPTYFNLIKTVEDDPEFDEGKAKKILKKFVEQHPHSIKVKTGIILDHLMNSTIHKIQGKGKAMLVTSSRKEAVLYKREFDRQIKENNLDIKALVAFSGTIEQDTVEYREETMNDIGNKSIPEAFKEDPYKILIVADKFQTGFDEPLLHTMYVDKKMTGVKAVQTLSRVNRIYPNKGDTLIIDFANDKDSIRESFEPFYEETYLVEGTDYSKLYVLMDEIYDAYLFDEEDVDKFVKAYKTNKPQNQLHNMLSVTVDKFKALADDKQHEFKKKITRFQNIYSFLSQLLPFSDIWLEKLFIYNKFLNKKLPTINNPLPYNILADVDIDSYKIDTSDKGTSIKPLEGQGELKPSSPTGVGIIEEDPTRLSAIIDSLNDAYGTEFTDDDKILINQLYLSMRDDEDLSQKIKSNSEENVRAIFDKYFDDEMTRIFENNFVLFKKINDDPVLRDGLKSMLLENLYKNKDL